jgi:uncharacterized UBP type Zn finger protein
MSMAGQELDRTRLARHAVLDVFSRQRHGWHARERNGRDTRVANCAHLDQIQNVSPSAQGCEECLQTGDSWVHLRICLICGHVGCCDASKNRHATRHYHETTHPIIQSFQPGEAWMWCYPDQTIVEPAR